MQEELSRLLATLRGQHLRFAPEPRGGEELRVCGEVKRVRVGEVELGAGPEVREKRVALAFGRHIEVVPPDLRHPALVVARACGAGEELRAEAECQGRRAGGGGAPEGPRDVL